MKTLEQMLIELETSNEGQESPQITAILIKMADVQERMANMLSRAIENQARAKAKKTPAKKTAKKKK